VDGTAELSLWEALQGSELWPLGWYLAGTADPIWARIAGSLDQDP